MSPENSARVSFLTCSKKSQLQDRLSALIGSAKMHDEPTCEIPELTLKGDNETELLDLEKLTGLTTQSQFPLCNSHHRNRDSLSALM